MTVDVALKARGRRGRPRADANRPTPTPAEPKQPPAGVDRLVFDINDLVAAGVGSRSMIYALAGAGRLPLRKILGRTVVLKSDLDAYLAGLPAAAIRPGKPKAA